jgi:hypothetical protein
MRALVLPGARFAKADIVAEHEAKAALEDRPLRDEFDLIFI